MVVTRYKPLFSVAVSYELAATGISSDGLMLNAMSPGDDAMYNFKLKPQYKGNTATVYFEGTETPAGAPAPRPRARASNC